MGRRLALTAALIILSTAASNSKTRLGDLAAALMCDTQPSWDEFYDILGNDKQFVIKSTIPTQMNGRLAIRVPAGSMYPAAYFKTASNTAVIIRCVGGQPCLELVSQSGTELVSRADFTVCDVATAKLVRDALNELFRH